MDKLNELLSFGFITENEYLERLKELNIDSNHLKDLEFSSLSLKGESKKKIINYVFDEPKSYDLLDNFNIPKQILYSIFKLLRTYDLRICMITCKHWKQLIEQNSELYNSLKKKGTKYILQNINFESEIIWGDLETVWEAERTTEDFGRIPWHLTMLLSKPNRNGKLIGFGKVDSFPIVVDGCICSDDSIILNIKNLPQTPIEFNMVMNLKWDWIHDKDDKLKFALKGKSKEHSNKIANFIEGKNFFFNNSLKLNSL